jgi:uncharacterized membrane protein
MDDLWPLLSLVGLAYLLAPIVGLVLAFRNRAQLRELERRVEQLARRIAPALRAAPAAETPAPPITAPQEPPLLAIDESPALLAPEPGAPETPEEPPVAAPPPSPPASQPAPPSPQPAPRPQPAARAAPPVIRESFEQRFGTRWVVWIGGVALALGGIFLVNYAVEQGYFGPGMRILLASILAVLLIAAGEWARRTERVSGLIGIASAHVPSVLTAAGTIVAFATAYAAFALYGFIGPAAAFVLLGAIGIITLAAALLHGPALAALGLVGAQVTPLLVTTPTPNYWALYIYLAVVTAAAFALARARLWRWLAISTITAGALWVLPGIADPGTLAPHAFHVAAGLALVAAFIVAGLWLGPTNTPGHVDRVSSGGLAAYLAAAALLVMASGQHDGAMLVFALLTAATVAIAWRAEAAAGAMPIAAVLSALVMAHWVLAAKNVFLTAPPTGRFDASPADVQWHLAYGFVFAVLFGVTGFLAQGRSAAASVPTRWAGASVFAPLAILAALYYRIAGFERSIPFAALALLLAALFGFATEVLSKRETRPGNAAAEAIYATGAVAALALALTLALEKGWLTVALAFMVAGIAWISLARPLPMLRWLAAAMVVVVLLRLAWDPRIVGDQVGTKPVFNWLLYGYGGPALAFWIGGTLLRRRQDDGPARIVDAGAILFTALLAAVEIRHYAHNGDIYASERNLTEVALLVCAGLIITIGLEALRERTRSIVHNAGALIVAGLTLVVIVFDLLLDQNPVFADDTLNLGGGFFNLVLVGYGVPAILAAILALRTRGKRPFAYRVTAVVTTIVLALTYFTLEVMRLYRGPGLAGMASDAEEYTYSAVWLGFAVVLILIGIALRSQPVRMCSAAVLIVTVLKVFLYDLASLTGIWRAFSFIGLGLVLVGIGYLYQRLLFRPAAPGTNVATNAAPP